jgi:hypothetical protein
MKSVGEHDKQPEPEQHAQHQRQRHAQPGLPHRLADLIDRQPPAQSPKHRSFHFGTQQASWFSAVGHEMKESCQFVAK